MLTHKICIDRDFGFKLIMGNLVVLRARPAGLVELSAT
jgi:hypothetical protein